MKSIEEIRTILRSHRRELKERYHVEEIALFGSYARGEQTDESDLDILVTLSAPLGWEFVDLHEYLTELLETKIELLTRGAVDRKPLLRHFIEKDLIRV
jgi:predicted nucleotidyltransferase